MPDYRLPMHIESVAILVDDYDAAIAFFVEALGFELVEDSPSLTNDGRAKRWVVVRPPGAATGLLLAAVSSAQAQTITLRYGQIANSARSSSSSTRARPGSRAKPTYGCK